MISTSCAEPFPIGNCRLSSETDAPGIHGLMTEVSAQAQPGLFVVDELADVTAWCRSGPEHFGLIIEDHGLADGPRRITAFVLARFPGVCDDNLGYDCRLSAEELPTVAHIESLAVAPAFRGRGLQRYLIRQAETRSAELGAHYAVCTIDPRNHWSLDNFTALGYEIVARRPKYGGLDRFILAKALVS